MQSNQGSKERPTPSTPSIIKTIEKSQLASPLFQVLPPELREKVFVNAIPRRIIDVFVSGYFAGTVEGPYAHQTHRTASIIQRVYTDAAAMDVALLSTCYETREAVFRHLQKQQSLPIEEHNQDWHGDWSKTNALTPFREFEPRRGRLQPRFRAFRLSQPESRTAYFNVTEDILYIDNSKSSSVHHNHSEVENALTTLARWLPKDTVSKTKYLAIPSTTFTSYLCDHRESYVLPDPLTAFDGLEILYVTIFEREGYDPTQFSVGEDEAIEYICDQIESRWERQCEKLKERYPEWNEPILKIVEDRYSLTAEL